MAIQIRTSLAEPEAQPMFMPHRPERPEKSRGRQGVPAGRRIMRRRATSRPRSPISSQSAREQGDRDPGAARRHRIGQDVHHGQGRRADAAPGAGARAQQDPRRPALWRVPAVLSGQCGGVLRQLLRLLPARGLCPALRHVHRERKLGERGDRPDAPFGHPVAARTRRRADRRLGVVPLRHWLGRNLFGDDLPARKKGQSGRPARDHPQAGRAAIQAQRCRPSPAARSGSAATIWSCSPRITRTPPGASSFFGDEIEEHHRIRSADRQEDRQPRIDQGLRQLALRHPRPDAEAGDRGDQATSSPSG